MTLRFPRLALRIPHLRAGRYEDWGRGRRLLLVLQQRRRERRVFLPGQDWHGAWGAWP